MSKQSTVASFISKNKRHFFLLGILILLLVFFSFAAPGFFAFNTLMNIVKQNAALAILSLGILFIIMLAGTDLSSGANVAFAGACGAYVMQAMEGQSVLAVAIAGFVVTVFAGALMGSVNGVLVGIFEVSPFMATLAVMSLSRGLTLFITQSRRIVVQNSIYNWFGQKNLIRFSDTISIPASILLLLVLFLIMRYVLNRTTFGRKTYAVGGNPVASRASGIFVHRHTWTVYMLGGTFAGFAAIVTVGRALSAQPLAGTSMEFDAITAVVLGGASLAGGTGSLLGVVLGAFLVGTIFSGLGMMPISPYYSYIFKGLLIILAVYIDQYAKAGRVKKQAAAPVQATSFRSAGDADSREPQELELAGITKSFPGVKALDNVQLKVRRGTVHALMGENGAGKSTLMKILSGVYSKDAGEIRINGKAVDIHSPMDSQKLGISVIYQEFALVPELNVTQNIFLGKEKRRFGLFLDHAAMKKEVRALLERFDLDISVNTRVADCTVGQQQMVEIAKAINSNAWVIVMDEPTSAITESEKKRLFEIIAELKAQGIAIIYISHRMSEIFEIADEITVLRDGQYVTTDPAVDVSEADLIKSMVGREVSAVFDRDKGHARNVVLEVRNLARRGVFEPISFQVCAGEVLGFSGLMGAGRTEVARCIFGLDTPDSGEIYLNGQRVDIRSPFDAIRAGIGYVSEDRRREGIVPLLSIRENVTLPSLPWINKLGTINFAEERRIADEYIRTLSVKTPSMEQNLGNLSGGNQQKVCLAKWLCRDPKVIILDEPTRGIDIGAKAEIHKLVSDLCNRGIAVILISSELPEVLGSSDRILVLHEGHLTKEFDNNAEPVTQEEILAAASEDSREMEAHAG